MTNFTEFNTKNIFIIPVGDYFNNESNMCYLVYSPLANTCFLAKPEEIEKLSIQIKNGEQNPIIDRLLNQKAECDSMNRVNYDSFCTLYFILNERCNFHCKYCYSAGGRSLEELSMDDIRTILTFFLSSERTPVRERSIMFIGGGEPLLSWEKVVETTLLAEEIASRNGMIINKGLTSNSSLFTDNSLTFLKEHHFVVQASFDVLPDVQNTQRGMYDKVSENLKRLEDMDIPYYIRSTITELNVDRIPEMIEHCYKNFPKVKHITCEHVVDPTYFTSTDIVDRFFDRYFNGLKEGSKKAKEYGLSLTSSTSHLTDNLKREKFCYNLVCVTPHGTLTLCPNISSNKEENYEQSYFAKLSNNGIDFNDAAFKRLTRGNIHTIEKCQNCYARWNCGSGCPNSRNAYSPKIFDSICNFYRRMVCSDLITKLANKYNASTGKDFFIDIATKL